jgi:hypothetical protein
MPFHKPYPRSFTPTSVRQHAPAESGVYALTNSVDWIYIGETDNIQQSLLQHLRQSDPVLHDQHATGFVFEICDRAKRTGRQDCLVQEYGPACNGQRSRYQ